MATITQLVKYGAGVSLMPLVGINDMISPRALRILNAKSTFRPFTYFASYIERPGDALPKITVEIAREISESNS